jgi:hypothetical protein
LQFSAKAAIQTASTMFSILRRKVAMSKAQNNVIEIRKRRRPTSKDAELVARVARANEDAELAAGIVWPDLGEPADWPENLETIADMDFAGVPEFVGDGHGSGTPEFREQLEAHFRVIAVAVRHALMVLGPSRAKLVVAAADLDETKFLLQLIDRGCQDLIRLTRYCRAAEVRLTIASVLHDMKAEGELPADGAAS